LIGVSYRTAARQCQNADTAREFSTEFAVEYTYMYTWFMPNKTLYVKDADLPMFEQAQEQLGDSVSSMFAEFLRERMANLRPEEGRIVELLHEIGHARDAANKERNLPVFIDAEYAEAEACGNKALKSFQRGDVRKTKVLFYAASTYRDKAERDLKEARAFNQKIAEMLGRA